MREYHLSKSDIDVIMQRIRDRWPRHISMNIKRPKTLKIIEMDDGSIDDNSILIGESIILVVKDGVILPFLTMQVLGSFPSVTVDMGAVRYVCNGASVMRPGIVGMDEFEKGSIVVVKDERYSKYIAVGIASVSSYDAKAMSKGVVIDNKHYISDMFWEECKKRGML